MQTDASNVTLPGLFANKCFRIPNYQRGYAWGESQLNDLWDDVEKLAELKDKYGKGDNTIGWVQSIKKWDDIMDIQKNGATYRPHYTGAITLQQIDINDLTPAEKKLSSTGMEYYNVVDGQQRLTTIVIMLNALKNKITTGKKQLIDNYLVTKNYVCRFIYSDTNGNSYRFFMKNIIGGTNILPFTSTIYTANLEYASKFFDERFSELKPKELKEFQEKLLTALVFDTKYIQDNLDVQAVFETMNNRGKPLTTLEKLKNRLLYMTSKFDPVNVDIKRLSDDINDSWGLIYETLGKNKDLLLSEDEFLSAYLTLLREPADYSFSESLAETKVFQMFCNHATKYDFSMARQHNSSIKEPAVDENKIHAFVSDIANYVRHWYDVYFPDLSTQRGLHLQKIQYLNGSKEMRLFLAELLMLANNQSTLVDECLEMVEKVLFKNALPGVSLLDERRFATRARDLHQGEMTLDELKDELESLLLQQIDIQSLIGGFRYLFTYVRGNIGFHRWSALKFFLMEYEKHLQGKGLSHVEWKNYYNVQIEHVMPRTWSNHWSNEMNNYLSAHSSLNVDEVERAKNILINTLGNLTVIQDIKNAGIGNNPWTTKQAAYSNGSYSEIEIATTTSWDPWGHVSIKARGKQMLDFLCDYLEYNGNRPLTISSDATRDDYTDILFYEDKYN